MSAQSCDAMRGHDHDDARLSQQLVQRSGLVLDSLRVSEHRHVRVVVGHVRALLAQDRHHAGRGCVASVLDVRLEGHAHHADLRAVEGPAAQVEGLRHQLHGVPRHGQVDVAGQFDEALDEVELARPPGQVVRVDRDAVAADARTRAEGHEAERLGRGRVDHFPDVQAHPLAQQSQLVDEGDVDTAEDVLEQLGKLGGVRRGERYHALVDVLEEALGSGRSLRRRAADQPGHVASGAGRIARVDPLGGEGEVEVLAGDEARLLQLRLERTGGGARERGRLQHH